MDLIKKLNNGYIFLYKLTLSTLKRKSNRNLKAIGFKDGRLIRIHDYRHSFASLSISTNSDFK